MNPNDLDDGGWAIDHGPQIPPPGRSNSSRNAASMVHSPAQADWIVRYGDAPCPIPPDARRVFTVEADGATLAEVWQR